MKKFRKRLLSFLLAVGVMASMTTIPVSAGGEKIHDIATGSIVINDTTCPQPCPGHIISGAQTQNTITVEAGRHNITLDNVHISTSNVDCPFYIKLVF